MKEWMVPVDVKMKEGMEKKGRNGNSVKIFSLLLPHTTYWLKH